MKSILLYLNEFDLSHDYKKQIADMWKVKADQTRNLIGTRTTHKPVEIKPAEKATPESEARRGTFDTSPEQFDKAMKEPSSEEAAKLQREREKEWEKKSILDYPKTTATAAALGVGAYMLYKKQKKKDLEDKKKMDSLDIKIKDKI